MKTIRTNSSLRKILSMTLLITLLISTFGSGMAKKVSAQETVDETGASLTVSLSAGQLTFGAADEVLVRVTLTNPSDQPVKILKWFIPSSDHSENLFNISVDGQAVPYIGAIYKRAAPSADDYMTFAAGESLTADVSLDASYNLTVSGNYSVAYYVTSDSLYLNESTGRNRPTLANTLTSDSLDLYIEGHPAPQLSPVNPDLVTASGSNAFTGCSPSEITALTSARTTAASYSADAVTYFNNAQQGLRYQYWFGTYDATRYNTVKSNFSAIKNYADSAAINFDCGCADAPYESTYAYVFSNDPSKIYLCGAFWSASTSGADSKAGTLIHEISHFDSVAGTDDVTYGYAPSHGLAPASAIINADSHEYFAENTPSLETTGAPAPVSNNLLLDPSFEAYDLVSSPWAQSSTTFDTPLCTLADCGGVGPRTGTVWSWFGGTTVNPEVASLSQSVTFPSGGGALLNFYLWMGAQPVGSDSTDKLVVRIDATQKFSVNATQAATYPKYKLISIDVSSFADGAPHTITFESTTTDQEVNFHVDDVSLYSLLKKTFTSSALEDGQILESAMGSTTGGSMTNTDTTINIGDDAANKQYRAILSFTTDVPNNAVLKYVKLKFKTAAIVGTDPLTTHGNLLADIYKGAFSGNNALELIDFQASASKSNVLSYTPSTLVSGWYTKLFVASGLPYIKKTGVNQFRLRYTSSHNNDLDADYLQIYSGDHATAANRPQLVIQYYIP